MFAFCPTGRTGTHKPNFIFLLICVEKNANKQECFLEKVSVKRGRRVYGLRKLFREDYDYSLYLIKLIMGNIQTLGHLNWSNRSSEPQSRVRKQPSTASTHTLIKEKFFEEA